MLAAGSVCFTSPSPRGGSPVHAAAAACPNTSVRRFTTPAWGEGLQWREHQLSSDGPVAKKMQREALDIVTGARPARSPSDEYYEIVNADAIVNADG